MPRRRKLLQALLALLVVSLAYAAWVWLATVRETPGVLRRAAEEGRLYPSLARLPEGFLPALLAVEDPGFYRHHGVDLTTPGAGFTTITQGLVKVYFFAHFRPGLAKLRQTVVALALDARVSKEVQLRLFVGSVYLGTIGGREVIGFEDGARTYFGKPLAALSRRESLALIATCIAPNELNLGLHPAQNAERVRRIERLLAGECRPRGLTDTLYADCGP